MAIKLYMDHNISSKITKGLRSKGVNIITAYEDNANEIKDELLLDRAGELGRVIFTHDRDFLKEGAKRQREGILFSGVIYVRQNKYSISQYINVLEYIAKEKEPEDLFNRVEYLPLKPAP